MRGLISCVCLEFHGSQTQTWAQAGRKRQVVGLLACVCRWGYWGWGEGKKGEGRAAGPGQALSFK